MSIYIEKINELTRDIARRDNEIFLFQEVANEIVSQLDYKQVLKLVADKAMELVHAESILIPILNKEHSHYSYLAASGENADVILNLGLSSDISVGMCGWVLRHEKPLLFGKDYPWEMDVKTVWEVGQDSALLVPLISRGKIVGGLSALGKMDGSSFTERDLNLLSLFSNQVSVAIENAQIFEELEKHRNNLQQLVDERTSELEETFKKLSKSQDLLFQSEKLASLGSMVAGVAHELNTPIGVGITGVTHLRDEISGLQEKLSTHTLTQNDLTVFLRDGALMADTMYQAMERAAEQILSFKGVAASHHSTDRRNFNLCQYINKIIENQCSEPKHQNIQIANHCPPDMEIYSYPGIFTEIISNLLSNSLTHGFQGRDKGFITIEASQQNQQLSIVYTDDGVGMDDKILRRIFEPFFTTRMGQGKGGLGLHFVYNLIEHKLNGVVSCESNVAYGTTFIISIPIT